MLDAGVPSHDDTSGSATAVKADQTDVDMEGDADAAAAAAATAARFRDERTVFVKGLRMGLRDGELDSTFRACGDLVEVRLMRDSDGRFRVR